MPCLVVVAKYDEDISWLDKLPSDWEKRVYDKGPSGEYENVGREAETFARFIVDEYDRIHTWDRILLLQGHPFDHECTLDHIIHSPEDPHPVAFGQVLACDGNGAPHHKGLKVAEAHAMLGLDPAIAAQNLWPFCAGAQFSLPPSAILKRSRDFWEKVHDALYTGAICPWTMERLWVCIFALPGL